MMDSTNQYHRSVAVVPTPTPVLKRSHSDMRRSEPLKWIDEDHYRDHVLQIPAGTNESEMDWKLKQEAEALGVVLHLQVVTNIANITSSLSGTTIASDPTNQRSAMSQSTAPTSCSSSEHRPVTSSTQPSDSGMPVSVMPAMLSDVEKKRSHTGFRDGIRKMAGFSRRRKLINASSTTLTSIDSQGSGTDSKRGSRDLDSSSIGKSIETQSMSSSYHHLPLRSPSIRSNRSSHVWSPRLPAVTRSSFEQPAHDALIDHEALKRSMECAEILSLQAKQLDEKKRFLDYQMQILSELWRERDSIKTDKQLFHRRALEQQSKRNEKAIEDLESRQLEEEMKVHKEHENEKRSILARLRHMEAYCQNPSPPPTPVDPSFSMSGSDRSSTSIPRGSVDSAGRTLVLHERKVTDKDYHSLASCYRERDAMDNLHAAKINVLRGKQKRAVENVTLRKEKELLSLEAAQGRELDEVDADFALLEARCRAEFDEKRRVLEKRWKQQAMVARAQKEKETGLKYEALPYVTAVESGHEHSDSSNNSTELRPPIMVR